MENVANTGNLKNTKVIIAIVAVVLVAIIAVVFFFMNKEEAYRSIQVYKVEGQVDVDRPQVGVLEAYANMMLQTLDIVNVSDNSNLQVKLDEDKYILLEPNTKIRLEAAGNSTDSKTKIYLEQGAIVCNIENKLSENSTYEVSTPNSTMAVRGTTFRVEVTFDEAGNSYTVAAVYEGVVESHLVYPNGELSADGVNISAGSQTEIKGTVDGVEYIITGEDITYEELEQVTLNFLDGLLDKGTKLSISKEELTSLISKVSKPDDKLTISDSAKTEETQESEVKESTTNGDTPVTGYQEATTDEETSSSTDISNNENLPNENVSDEDVASDDTDDEIVEPTLYTVTFTYGGTPFAVQTVASGECATTPRLLPTSEGYWDYDFSQPITADITLIWVDTAPQS